MSLAPGEPAAADELKLTHRAILAAAAPWHRSRMPSFAAAEVARWQRPTKLWLDHARVREEDLEWMAPVQSLVLWNVRLPERTLAYSWLALEARDSVGWFSINGSGPVPERLCEDPDGMHEHEVRLGAWVKSTGRAFQFGAGDSMWLDAAAVGIYPFDFDDRAQQYRLVASPTKPFTAAGVPSHLRELLVVQLGTADFSQGFVTPTDIDGG